MALTVEALLGRLRDTAAVELREAYDHPEHRDLWDRDTAGPRLYRAFSRALLNQGNPTLALNLARRGLETFAHDIDLGYTVALAYARGGNLPSSEQALAPALDAVTGFNGSSVENVSPGLRVEVVTLRGRLFKDQLQRETDSARRTALARQSSEWYLRAAGLPGADAFPLINAATMRLVAGDAAGAHSLARQICERWGPESERPDRAGDYWLRATLGEAQVLLGNHDRALAEYLKAADRALAEGAVGALVSMLGNLRLLVRAGATADPTWLEERLGSVVVFAGHRIDPPSWSAEGKPPRFPDDPALVGRVQQAIREGLRRLNARFGFCSLASGADLLFAEAMQERGAELHAVLPFAAADFLRTSVDYGNAADSGPAAWRCRFEAVLAGLKPDHLHYATAEPYLGTDLLFGYANTFLQGLAVVRARQCLIDPVALVVLDPGAEALPGGTVDFLDDWRRAGLRAEVIDLATLRGGESAPRLAPALPHAWPPSELPRSIRVMLFGDVAGFSKMDEEQAPRFFADFPRAVAAVLAKAGARVLLANTWGDGFFAVFDRVTDCAAFALDLLDEVGTAVDWHGMGFPDANPLRVGLHAGPVFELAEDPILHRRNFFGRHVNRAARIEPVTIPGCAFASEQFAALLTMEAGQAFRSELIGVEKLPKGSGSLSLYRISRP